MQTCPGCTLHIFLISWKIRGGLQVIQSWEALRGLPRGLRGKNLPANEGGTGDVGSGPGSGSSLGEEVEPTPVSSPGEPHEQRRVMVHQVRKSQTQPSTHAPRGKHRMPFTFSGREKSRRAPPAAQDPHGLRGCDPGPRSETARGAPWADIRSSPLTPAGDPEQAT